MIYLRRKGFCSLLDSFEEISLNPGIMNGFRKAARKLAAAGCLDLYVSSSQSG
jgi:hypothetical protein